VLPSSLSPQPATSSPHCAHRQVEVSRAESEVVSVTGTYNAQLSPSLPTDGLPPVVDTIRIVWPINPYGSLSKGETPLGFVMDFFLLDAGNHSIGDLNLPDMPVAGSSSMPVHFRVPLGAWHVHLHSGAGCLWCLPWRCSSRRTQSVVFFAPASVDASRVNE
jgi:hypothetical protein